jgi:hypothetical protein
MRYLSCNIYKLFTESKGCVKAHLKRKHVVLRYSKVLDGSVKKKDSNLEYKNQGSSRS